MFDVPEIHSIRVLHQRGYSQRKIAKMLGVSRVTVAKYLDPDFVVTPEQRMNIKVPRSAPKLDPWKALIDQWLKEDESRPRKQRRTARKIHKDLVSRYAADVSEQTVRRYVAAKKHNQAKKAYVPLTFPMGSMAEADFGHALCELDGQEIALPFFAFRLMASGVSFVKLYDHEKLESMLDGIASGLSFLGGVPAQVMFDNTKVLVKKILGGGNRALTPEFKALCAHYGFEAVFANPASGNEKGGVENVVQWAQRNLFSPVPRGKTIHELNAWLEAQCLESARTRRYPATSGPFVIDLWEQEQTHLGQLPVAPFPACRYRFVRVDKTCLVTYDKAVYSVPAAYVGKSLTLRAFWDHVEVTDGKQTVALHERQHPGGSSLQLQHYLPVLAKKPRAVSHATVIARGEPALAAYRDGFLAARPGAWREMVAILQLCHEVGLPKLAKALQTAHAHHAYDIESVKALLAMDEQGPTWAPAALSEAQVAAYPATEVQGVASEVYAFLSEVAAGGEA